VLPDKQHINRSDGIPKKSPDDLGVKRGGGERRGRKERRRNKVFSTKKQLGVEHCSGREKGEISFSLAGAIQGVEGHVHTNLDKRGGGPHK